MTPMEQFKKLICILLCALMCMSALSGCAEKEVPEDERFVLRAGVCGPVETLDPALNTDARAESVLCALYENLMRTEDDGEGRVSAVPGIAKEYKETANFDGTVEYAFTLRSSARWSDGSRVRARDFAYAWRRLADPATNSPHHAMLSMVQGYDIVRETGDITQLGVKADGDSVFRVTLAAPCPYFLRETCTAAATMPLRSEQCRENPDWAQSTSLLCNGPYQVGVWAKEEYLQLRRNPSYYGGSSTGPDTLRFVFTSDAAAAWQMYEDGKLDYVSAPPERGAQTEYLPLRATTCVFYNHLNEAFGNMHVRRAFDLTVDRSAAAAAAGAGMAPATGLVPPGVADASADGNGDDFRTVGGALCAVDAEGYSMRCLEAETELRSGGYWGGVGFPETRCICVEGEAEAIAAALAVSGMWSAQLKLNVSVECVPQEEFDRRIAEGEYEIAVTTLRAVSGDAMDLLAPFAAEGAGNLLHYASTPYDLLLGVAGTSRDVAARTAFLHDAEALLLDDAALTPLYFGASAYQLREGLTGVRHDLRGNVLFNAVTRVEAGET